MEQNTEDWLIWREGGLGSSDAPIIMEASSYSTPLQLFNVRTKRTEKEGSNFIQQRGHDFELTARAHYELMCEHSYPATNVQHKTIDWLRASLDGLNINQKRFIEIKYQGAEQHEIALDELMVPFDRVRESYQWQLVHQFNVTGLPYCDFVSYNPEHPTKLAVVKIEINETIFQMAKELFAKEKIFWELLQSDTAPPLSDKDYKKEERPEVISYFQDLLDLRDTKQPKRIKSIKQVIIPLMDHPRVECLGIRASQSNRKGKVVTTFRMPK